MEVTLIADLGVKKAIFINQIAEEMDMVQQEWPLPWGHGPFGHPLLWNSVSTPDLLRGTSVLLVEFCFLLFDSVRRKKFPSLAVLLGVMMLLYYGSSILSSPYYELLVELMILPNQPVSVVNCNF